MLVINFRIQSIQSLFSVHHLGFSIRKNTERNYYILHICSKSMLYLVDRYSWRLYAKFVINKCNFPSILIVNCSVNCPFCRDFYSWKWWKWHKSEFIDWKTKYQCTSTFRIRIIYLEMVINLWMNTIWVSMCAWWNPCMFSFTIKKCYELRRMNERQWYNSRMDQLATKMHLQLLLFFCYDWDRACVPSITN